MSVKYNKKIGHLQNELKTKDKIIDQLLKSLSSLTNSELKSKNNKLLVETNDEEKKKSIRRQNDINTKFDTADKKSDEKDAFDSTKKIKEHAERIKVNNSSNNTEPRDGKLKTNNRKKKRVGILGDSMLNGIQQKRVE